MKFPIANFIPEGITFFGALPTSGKTWLCLSMAKAICTGQKFLGQLAVDESSNVLYLIPESGERSFRQRMESMNLPDDERFLCRTMSDGPIRLSDRNLLSAIRDLKPIVFLDTAVRFNPSDDENDASKSSKLLAEAVFALIKAGAKAVVCAHHSTKAAKKNVTLESCLRGSGDIGAMADAVYYLEVTEQASLTVKIVNKKARDFEPIPDFEVVGRPFINEIADFKPATAISEPQFAQMERQKLQKFVSVISKNPRATFSDLEKDLNILRATLQRIADKAGWTKGGGLLWVREAESVAKAA
jgi:RecA-family ATPase